MSDNGRKTPADTFASDPETRRKHDPDLPGVATPDQTRQSGMRPELAKTLSHADTSGIVELRKRKGGLEGM